MRFNIDKSYPIRHGILELLYEDQEVDGVCDRRITSPVIQAKLKKYKLTDIHRYHEILKKDDEIDCCEQDGEHRMFIKEAGRYAYLENKYPIAGRAELWEYWYQPLKVIVPALALIVATVAIILNYKQSQTVEKLNKRIDSVEQTTKAKNLGKENTQAIDTLKK